MTAERETKVFVLGIANMKGVDSAGWLEDLPNLADYDRIFVSTISLSELLILLEAEVNSSKDENNFIGGEMLNRLTDVSSRLALVRKQLAKVLATGGSVISLIQP